METQGIVWAQDFEHTEFKGKGYGGGRRGSGETEKKRLVAKSNPLIILNLGGQGAGSID